MALQKISQIVSCTWNGAEIGVLNNSVTYQPAGYTLDGQITDQGKGGYTRKYNYGTLRGTFQWFNLPNGPSGIMDTTGNVCQIKTASGAQFVFENCWSPEQPSGNMHESGVELNLQHDSASPEIF